MVDSDGRAIPEGDEGLRRRAEATARERAGARLEPGRPRSPEALEEALRELRVHQIELELQNDELRRAHLELDDVRARYFDLYDRAPVGYCTLDGQGRIEEANLTAASLLGVPRQALKGRPIYGFIVQEDRDHFYLERQRLLESERPHQAWELRMSRADGTRFWARLEVTPVGGADPEALRLVMVDVSERKAAEDELRESGALLKGITDAIPDPIILKDGDGRCLFANPATLKLLGRSLDEVLGKTDVELHDDPRATKAMAESGGRVMDSGVAEIVEETLRVDGAERTFRTSRAPFRDADGFVVGVVGTARDVTARRRAEAALKESERGLRLSESQMQMAQQLGQTGSWLFDVDTAQVWGSAEALRIFGYPAVARFGPMEDIELCIPDRAHVHAALVALIEEGRAYDLDYVVHPADGSSPRQVHAIARIERDADGKQLGVIGFVQDVTQRKETEAKLQRLAAAQTEASRLKDVFTDVLRHDILNPVGAIKLTLELLLLEEAAPAKVRLLQRARQSTLNLVEMTENAAKLALLAAGQASHFDAADPVAVLRTVLPDFEHKVREKRLTLRDHTVSGGFVARFNPILKNVFANLISNAIKYCPEETVVDLGIVDEGAFWVFSVRDRGAGVPDEHKRSIFSRFERLDKLGVKGSGLGLAITKEVVALHGGEIWVEDAPERGSVFVAKLPKSPPARSLPPVAR